MTKNESNINPSHYRTGKLEVITIMKDKLSPEEFKGFCKGLILKYIYRADSKNGIEDYEKAEWYLKCLIKYLKENQNENM